MILTLQTQILPNKEQVLLLEETLRAFNAAATWLAGKAFEARTANKIALQKLHYQELRERFGLSAQMAVRCIAQTCEAYKRDRNIQPVFKEFASMPFDQRMMSFKGVDRLSLLTLQGRIIVPLVMGAYQKARFAADKGQCDLVRRKDGKWFFLVSVDLPPDTVTPTTDFLGVDLGVTNIATDSDRSNHTGDKIEAVRLKYNTRRKHLQKAADNKKNSGTRPKNIRRALKRASCKESAFRKNTNHVISKKIVTKAKGTSRGIALENLEGIRDRIRLHKPQRNRMHGWSFRQLRMFIEYKAAILGVPVVLVDPKNTSRECAACGCIDKRNRPSQSEFLCVNCGYADHADINAAQNIRARALVNVPKVSERHQDFDLAA